MATWQPYIWVQQNSKGDRGVGSPLTVSMPKINAWKVFFLIVLVVFAISIVKQTDDKKVTENIAPQVLSVYESATDNIQVPQDNTSMDKNQEKEKVEVKLSQEISIAELYRQIEKGNFANLNKFHYQNLECSSVKGFESKNEYMAEFARYSDLEASAAEAIYDSCSQVKIKNFKEIEVLYLEALNEGKKEAEFLLGVMHPPSFRNSIYWLSRAATWRYESVDLISEAIYSSSASDNYKTFWSYVLKSEDNTELANLESEISFLEIRIDETTRQSLLGLANAWTNSTSETERRDIIDKLDKL